MPRNDLKVVKSRNYDRNLDSSLLIKRQQKTFWEIGQNLEQESLKLVPIATRQTYNSVRSKTSGNTINITSINWRMKNGQTRYKYKLSSVQKNRDKYEWFKRTFKKNRAKYSKKLREGTYA